MLFDLVQFLCAMSVAALEGIEEEDDLLLSLSGPQHVVQEIKEEHDNDAMKHSRLRSPTSTSCVRPGNE